MKTGAFTWAGRLVPLFLVACNLFPKSAPIPEGEIPKFFTLADSAALFPGRPVIAIPDKEGRDYLYFPPWGRFDCSGGGYSQYFRIGGTEVSIRTAYSRCSNPADAKALVEGYRPMKMFPGAEYREAADLPGLKQGIDVETSTARILVGYSGGIFYQVEIEPPIPIGSDGLRWVAGRISRLKG